MAAKPRVNMRFDGEVLAEYEKAVKAGRAANVTAAMEAAGRAWLGMPAVESVKAEAKPKPKPKAKAKPDGKRKPRTPASTAAERTAAKTARASSSRQAAVRSAHLPTCRCPVCKPAAKGAKR